MKNFLLAKCLHSVNDYLYQYLVVYVKLNLLLLLYPDKIFFIIHFLNKYTLLKPLTSILNGVKYDKSKNIKGLLKFPLKLSKQMQN